MFSQIVCFFVVLISMSELRSDKMEQTILSIHNAFNMYTDFPRLNPIGTTMNFQQALNHFTTNLNKGKTEYRDAAITWPKGGTEVKVFFVREGVKVVIGGRAAFKKGDDKLSQLMESRLRDLSDVLRGYRYKVLVIGHDSREPFGSHEVMEHGQVTEAGDQAAWNTGRWELSYKRARNVAKFLVEEGKIEQKRIRISAAGDTDQLPLTYADKMDYEDYHARNRRVEIIVSEEEVQPDYAESAKTGGK
jgi:outer membrane protein OmpA-like peptidoglycan-associated protein